MERKDSTTNIHNIHTQTYTILTTNHNSSHKVGTPSYKPTKLHNTHKKSRVGHKKSHLYIYIYTHSNRKKHSIPQTRSTHHKTIVRKKENSKDSHQPSTSPINHKKS